jgi:hypothetical protein
MNDGLAAVEKIREIDPVRSEWLAEAAIHLIISVAMNFPDECIIHWRRQSATTKGNERSNM